MLLHTIVQQDPDVLEARGIELEREDMLFTIFIRKRIFPGGQLCPARLVADRARAAGFKVARQHSLQLHYAQTLQRWAVNLEAAKDRAISLTSQEVYDTYLRYLTGCERYFRNGKLDVVQFTLEC